jgi:hypothetical protein
VCLAEWDGHAPPNPGYVVKLMDRAEADKHEVDNLKACHRYVAGWSKTNLNDIDGLVIHRGIGETTLEGSAAWTNSKGDPVKRQALVQHVAPQIAALIVQWMGSYGRMHTDPHPGNVSHALAHITRFSWFSKRFFRSWLLRMGTS